MTDYGINDGFMKDLSASIQPGYVALFLLIKEMTPDKVLDQIKDYGGVVLKASLDGRQGKAFSNALAGSVASDSAQAAMPA